MRETNIMVATLLTCVCIMSTGRVRGVHKLYEPFITGSSCMVCPAEGMKNGAKWHYLKSNQHDNNIHLKGIQARILACLSAPSTKLLDRSIRIHIWRSADIKIQYILDERSSHLTISFPDFIFPLNRWPHGK